MRHLTCLLVLGVLVVAHAADAQNQGVSVGEVADRAEAQSKLTTPGSTPFHLKATVSRKDDSDSHNDLTAELEVFWASPEKWRRTITSPGFTQTLIVNGDAISEQDTGDYYPFWLREYVTAMLDPLPMVESLKQMNQQIAKPSGNEEVSSCARFRESVGVLPVQNSVFTVICFAGYRGLVDYVVSPSYTVDFKDYKDFKNKRVARHLESDAGSGIKIAADVTELSELTSVDESLFEISRPTPSQAQLQSIIVSEAHLRNMTVQDPDIVWPSIRGGKTTGVLSIYVSIDKSGHVRETFPLNSDNPDMSDAAAEQLNKWQFKPAVTMDGAAVQVEGILTFAYTTKIENPVATLSDADARKLATNIVEPQIPAGIAAGTTFTVFVQVGTDGKLLGVSNYNNVPTPLFQAAYQALQQWHFQPYVKDGKADVYNANITFQLH